MDGVTLYTGGAEAIKKTGNGKTLAMVNELYSAYLKGKTVYTNLELNFPHKKIKSFMDILKEMECIVGIDELGSFLGNIYTQAGMDPQIKSEVSIFADQHRKRDIEFHFTNQYYMTTTKVIRQRVNYIAECWKVHIFNNSVITDDNHLKRWACLNDKCTFEHAFVIKLYSINGLLVKKYVIPPETVKRLYPLYDTLAIVEPITESYKKKAKGKS